jgi:hypothetical protein
VAFKALSHCPRREGSLASQVRNNVGLGLTLHANVCRFSRSTKATCSSAECELPLLAGAELRAVRVKLKTECEASGQRLDDIANRLEDAIQDWSRFIAANALATSACVYSKPLSNVGQISTLSLRWPSRRFRPRAYRKGRRVSHRNLINLANGLSGGVNGAKSYF